jgi:hypothetical protein
MAIGEPLRRPLESGSREWFANVASERHPATLHLMKYFAYSHLKGDLAEISQAVGDLASVMIHNLPDGPELSAGLRKLLEAKDCFVRTALDKREEERA